MASVTKETIVRPETEPAPLPSGPAAAAILAGGIGSAWYGLMVVLAESIKSFGDMLNFYKPVGPLSGKTIVGVIGFLIAWGILGSQWKGKEVKVEKVWPIALALIVVGLLLSFPPVFELFAD